MPRWPAGPSQTAKGGGVAFFSSSSNNTKTVSLASPYIWCPGAGWLAGKALPFLFMDIAGGEKRGSGTKTE